MMKSIYVPVMLLAIATLPVLNSCSLLGNLIGRPTQEQPPSPDESYLPNGGNNDIDLGPDQSKLVEDLQTEMTKVRDLREKIKRLESDKTRLSSELKSTKTNLAQNQRARTTSEHEAGLLTKETRELQTKILMLQIKTAQLEQANILLRLAAISSQQDAMNASRVNASPMSGANR